MQTSNIGKFYYCREDPHILFFRCDAISRNSQSMLSYFIINREGKLSTDGYAMSGVYEEVTMSQILDYYFDGELPPWWA